MTLVLMKSIDPSESRLNDITIGNIEEIRNAAKKAKTIKEWKRILREKRDKFGVTTNEILQIAKGNLP